MCSQICLFTCLLFVSLITKATSLTENEILSISITLPNIGIAMVTIIVLCIIIYCVAKLMCLRKEIILRQMLDTELQNVLSRQTESNQQQQPVETENPPSYQIAIEMYDNSSNSDEV